MISRVQKPRPKTAQNRTLTKETESSSPKIPWNNSLPKKNPAVDPGIEAETS